MARLSLYGSGLFVQIIELPYSPDSQRLFSRLRGLPYPAFLDSGPAGASQGRYDILSAAPVARVVTEGGKNWLTIEPDSLTGGAAPASEPRALSGTPFEALQQVLARYAPRPAHAPADAQTDLPFWGGALGYFAYDLGRELEQLPEQARRDIPLPEMQVGIYRWALINDHQRQRTLLTACADVPAKTLTQIRQRLESPLPTTAPFELLTPFQADMDRAAYRERFERVNAYIHAGDCYQVNLAQRVSAPFRGCCWTAYQALRQQAPTPFSAYLEFPDCALLSLSPERFLEVRGTRVETRPIKGTRPRGKTAEADRALRQALASSLKDRAENLMIVDLLRNDLGKTCRSGSVRVPRLFAVESYANVHHLVSTITGELATPKDSLRLLQGCFPGGSITGAPKLRAMEIIEELEPVRRSVYCGSIGYVGFDGSMDTSICIRTLIAQNGRLHCWGGGGLVADSQWEDEYAETFAKIGNLTATLERFLPGATG